MIKIDGSHFNRWLNMDKEKLRSLFEQVKNGQLDIDQALRELRAFPFEDLGFVKFDTSRDLRVGFPEVILCKGKSLDQITAIVRNRAGKDRLLVATKAEPEVFAELQQISNQIEYHQEAKIVVIGEGRSIETDNTILILSAGTSDIPIAEEAAVTAEIMGNKVECIYDVGVAGVHRLTGHKEQILSASVIVVVAGMEGALASLVAGLVDSPVIAVPTSVGYGASFDGLCALLSMLNCCAPGVTVVNIDNGFGAGYFAGMVNLMGAERKKTLSGKVF